MNERNYWEEFCHTGKIADYLSYRSATDRSDAGSIGQDKEKAGSNRDEGALINAGTGSCHRDHIKS